MRWRHKGWTRRWRGRCALRWLMSRLNLQRRHLGRRLVCGALYWRNGGSVCSKDLLCGCARHRRAAESVVIRAENSSRVELRHSEERAANFQYVAKAKVLGIKL